MCPVLPHVKHRTVLGVEIVGVASTVVVAVQTVLVATKAN